MKRLSKRSSSKTTVSPFDEFFELNSRGDVATPLATVTPSKFEDFLVVLALAEDIPKAQRAFFILLACVGPTLDEIQNVSKLSLKWTETGEKKSLTVKIGKSPNHRVGIVNSVVQDFIWETLDQLVELRPFKWSRKSINKFLDLYFDIEGVRTISFRESGMRYLVNIKKLDTIAAGKLLGLSAEQSSKHAIDSDIDEIATLLAE